MNRFPYRTFIDKLTSMRVKQKDEELKSSFALFEYQHISAAAGSGNPFADIAPEYCFLRKNDRNARADAVIRVSGHSMEPVYQDGDHVYIEYVSTASSGEDVICSCADGVVIKRLNTDGTLYSVNPDYPFGKKTEDDNVRVLGRVLVIVSSSDRPSKNDVSALNELFVDEIHEFEEEHGMDGCE